MSFTRAALLWPFLLFNSAIAIAVDSRQALQEAANLVQEGRLEEADQQARFALSDPQTRAAACSVLGTIRFQQKRFRESVSFFQQAIHLEPRLVGARLSLAEEYTLQGKPALAFELYRRVLELDPANASARLALARSESEKGNYRHSLELAKAVLKDFKQSPDGLVVLAADYLKTGDRASAAALTQDWMHLSGVPTEWSLKFALLLAQEGMTDQAIDILEHAGQSGSRSYELAFHLAELYALRNQPALGLEQYDAALSANPESIPALLQAAMLAERHGELERSLSYWFRAKKVQPDDPEVLLGFGRLCLKMDLLEDAEPALTKAASLRPDDPSYQYSLASVKVGKRQFEAAHEILAKLVQKQANDSQLQYALGSVLYLEGRLADAAMHLQVSARLQPNQFASYYYLALIARDEGNEPEAIQQLEKLLQQFPDHAPSCEVLGELLMSAHRYAEAETNFEKALRLNPKSVKANYQLGLLLSRMGKKDEADKQLQLAKSLRADDEANSRLQLRLLDPINEQ